MSICVVDGFTPVWVASYPRVWLFLYVYLHWLDLHLNLHLHHLCKVQMRCICVYMCRRCICTHLGEFIFKCIAVPIPVLIFTSLVITPSPILSLQGPYEVQSCLCISSVSLHLSW